MKSTLLPFLSFLFALIGLGAAGYFWRRASSLYALLVEGASRYEALRAHAVKMEKEHQIATERLTQNRDAIVRMEKSIDESRARVASIAKQLEAKEQEQIHVTEKLELQKNHLIKQFDAVNARLELTISSKNEAEQRLNDLTQKTEGRFQSQINELRSTNKDLRQRLEQTESALKKSEELAAKSANPDEVRLLKRKLAQFERLYAGMKGMRELADERNQNLETAVRKLATYTLKSRQAASNDAQSAIPTTLGPLVGGALEVIGAVLIDDADALDFSGPTDASL